MNFGAVNGGAFGGAGFKGFEIVVLNTLKVEITGLVGLGRPFLSGAGFGQRNEVGGVQVEDPAQSEEGIQLGSSLVSLEFGDHGGRNPGLLGNLGQGKS